MKQPRKPKRSWGLLQRRECLVPTKRGWLLLLLAGCLGVYLATLTFHRFLSMNRPVSGGILVVEGWAPDYVLEAAIVEFHQRPYTHMYVTGGPLEQGTSLSKYVTFAQLGYRTLLQLGMNTNQVTAVPAPLVLKDRTYISALALRKYLREQHLNPRQMNLFTMGAHARRSRLLFEKALPPDIEIGVISMSNRNYSPARWWRTSAGVRTVISEGLAYIYARLLFWPDPEKEIIPDAPPEKLG